MDTLTFVLPLLAGGSAIVAHSRIQSFGLACLIAAFCATPPCLVMFDLSGSSKTDFAPFNLFVLFCINLAISALIGVPFWLLRKWQCNVKSAISLSKTSGNMPTITIWRQQSWSLQMGIATTLLLTLLLKLLVSFALNARQLATPTIPLEFIFVILLVAVATQLLSGVILYLLFQAGVHLVGYDQPIPAKHEFLVGMSLSATLLLLFVLTDTLAPPEWNQGVHRLSFALDVNWFFFLPVLFGWQYAKRIS